jgi:hypothetical protein
MAWEIIFMLVILKIPVVYLCTVVWWAIKAEPTPPGHEELSMVSDTPLSGDSQRWRRPGRPRPNRPHSGGRVGGSPAAQRGGTHA